MTTLKVASPGSTVHITAAGMDVTVEDVHIMGMAMQIKYYVVWWVDKERKGVWVCSHELDIPDSVIHIETKLEGE